MRLPRILNQCHPIPGFVYGKASFAEDEQAVLIAVRPRKRSAAICSGCHQPASGYDQSPTPRRFEFIGFWGYLVFLVYCMRRVNCKQCGVLVEEVPWGMGKHTSTKIHMHFLGHWARKLSWKETAEEFRTSWDKVHDAVAYLVTWGLEHRVLGAIRAIGVDEIQYGNVASTARSIPLHTPSGLRALVNQSCCFANEYLAAENRIFRARLQSLCRLMDPERSWPRSPSDWEAKL